MRHETSSAGRRNLHPSRGVRNMTAGNPYVHIMAFAVPIFLSQVFQQLYNTADTLIVGRILGTAALAAVGTSGTLIFMLVTFFDGVAMGAGVVISRYFGAHDDARVSRAIHTTLALALLSSLILTVLGIAFSPVLSRWMKVDPEVYPLAVEYLRVYFAGSATLIFYNVCRGIMTSVGDSWRPLFYLAFSSILNVVLDVLFVGTFGWGVWAAGLATVISQGASVVLCMFHLLKKGHVFSVELKKVRIHRDMVGEILHFGVPSGIQNSIIALSNVVVQSQINSFGTIATAACSAYAKIENFVFLPIISFNTAITTFISQNLGAREHERAKKGARFGIIAAVLLAESVGVLFYLFAPQLMAMFDSSPAVIALGAERARNVTLFYFLLAFSHAIMAVCRGAGKTITPMLVMLGVWCVLRIIFIMLVMRFFGEIQYIFYAYPLTWLISSVIYLVYYLRGDWVHGFEPGWKRQ